MRDFKHEISIFICWKITGKNATVTAATAVIRWYTYMNTAQIYQHRNAHRSTAWLTFFQLFQLPPNTAQPLNTYKIYLNYDSEKERSMNEAKKEKPSTFYPSAVKTTSVNHIYFNLFIFFFFTHATHLYVLTPFADFVLPFLPRSTNLYLFMSIFCRGNICFRAKAKCIVHTKVFVWMLSV